MTREAQLPTASAQTAGRLWVADRASFSCRICVTVVTFRPEHQKHVVFSTLALATASAQTVGRI